MMDDLGLANIRTDGLFFMRMPDLIVRFLAMYLKAMEWSPIFVPIEETGFPIIPLWMNSYMLNIIKMNVPMHGWTVAELY